MKTQFDWGDVPDDRTFRQLCHRLLGRLYAGGELMLPDAPGRDYQIDARRTDPEGNRTVYSLKFYSESQYGNLKKALRSDLEGARGYRAGLAGERARELWSGVTRYELWTNMRLSPQRSQELSDLIEAAGFDADVVNQSKLEGFLQAHADVVHRFSGTRKVLLLPLEDFEQNIACLPLGKYYGDALPLSGREGELTELRDRLREDEPPLIVLTGPSAVGKTRLLLELARRMPDERMYFLDGTVSESELPAHVDELLAARGGVLLVDDADRTIPLWAEMVRLNAQRGEFGGSFRFILVTRRVAGESVLEAARGLVSSDHLAELRLEPLDNPGDLVEGLGYEGTVKELIAGVSQGLPMLAVFAHEAVQHGEDPRRLTRDKVVQNYLQRCLHEAEAIIPQTQLDQLLIAAAAIAPANEEAQGEVGFLSASAQVDEPDVRRVLASMETGQLLERRGRLLRLYPSILGDHVLKEGLYDDLARPTGRHLDLLRSAPADAKRRVVGNLARLEAVTGESLLEEVLEQASRKCADWSNPERLNHIEVFAPVAYFRPHYALRVADTFLTYPRSADSVEGEFFGHEVSFEVTHDQVLRELTSFVAPCAYRDGFLDRTCRVLEEIAVVQGASELGGLGATGRFKELCGWKRYFRAPWQLELLDWICARARDVAQMAGPWPEPRLRARFLMTGLREVLRLRVEVAEAKVDAVTVSLGKLRLEETVSAIRDKALEALAALSRAQYADTRAEATDALLDAWRELAHYHIEGDSQAVAESQAARIGDILVSAASAERVPGNLRRLRAAAAAVAEHCRHAAKIVPDWTALVAEIVDAVPGFDLWRRAMGLHDALDVDEERFRLGYLVKEFVASVQPGELLEKTDWWTSDPGATRASGLLHNILISYAATHPDKAKEALLSARLGAAQTRSLAPYIGALFIGLRQVQGDAAIEWFEQQGLFEGAEGYLLYRWNRPEPWTPTNADRRFVGAAVREADSDRLPALVPIIEIVTDPSGDFLQQMTRELLGRDADDRVAGQLAEVWDHVLYKCGDEAIGQLLPPILLEFAGHPRLLSGRSGNDAYHLQRLLAVCCNQIRGFLADFVARRLEAFEQAGFSAEYEVWFDYGEWLSRDLKAPREDKASALRSIARFLHTHGIRYLWTIDQMYRDLCQGDVAVAEEAAISELGEGTDRRTVVTRAALLRGFDTSEQLVQAADRILAGTSGLARDEAEGVEGELWAALMPKSWSRTHGQVAPEHENARSLFQKYEQVGSTPQSRRFFGALRREVERDMKRERHEDEEADWRP
jgi:hypothetical protein